MRPSGLMRLLVLVVTMCAVTQVAAAKTTITYWYFYVSDVQEQFLEKAVAEFNESHPDIEVKAVHRSGNLYDQTMAAIAGGAAPDVLHFERSAIIEWVAGRGNVFEPLDRYLSDELRAPGAFLPFAGDEVKYEGKTWAIPFGTDVRGLIWHTEHLDEAGIDSSRPPRTLEELESDAVRLTKKTADGRIERLGFAPWIGNWRLQGWFWAFGGGVYNAESKQPTINIPQNNEALTWVQDFAQRLGPAAAQFPRGRGEFTEGRRSMGIEANVTYEQFLRTSPDLKMGVGRVPHADTGKNGTWSGGYAHVIPVGSKHPQEAAEFLNFLNSAPMQVRYFEETGGLPTNAAAFYQVLKEPHDPGRMAFLEQLPESNARPPLWLTVHLALGKAADEVVAMEKSPQQALIEVQEYMENQFAEVMGW